MIDLKTFFLFTSKFLLESVSLQSYTNQIDPVPVEAADQLHLLAVQTETRLDWKWRQIKQRDLQQMRAEQLLLKTSENSVILSKFPSLFCDQLNFQWSSRWLSVVWLVFCELTQMLETCWYESLQGRAGYIIYTYCMYTMKLKALILSIVFNYLRFLMMKIDCIKFFFIFACACCCQNKQM